MIINNAPAQCFVFVFSHHVTEEVMRCYLFQRLNSFVCFYHFLRSVLYVVILYSLECLQLHHHTRSSHLLLNEMNSDQMNSFYHHFLNIVLDSHWSSHHFCALLRIQKSCVCLWSFLKVRRILSGVHRWCLDRKVTSRSGSHHLGLNLFNFIEIWKSLAVV